VSGHYERKLAKHLDEQGYHVVRAPSSGGGTKRELPDLFWAKPSEAPIAAELKTTSQNVAYYDESEVAALQSFARSFDATPVLVARFKGDTTYYAVHIENPRITDSGRYAVDRDIEPSLTIEP